jgi:hypothetical protein
MVTFGKEDDITRCSVYCNGAGAVLNPEIADMRLIKIISKVIPKTKKK